MVETSPVSFAESLLGRMEGASKGERAKVALMVSLTECLKDHHLSEVTISDLARRAGLSNGALYHYFSGRNALVAATLEAFVGFVQGQMQDASRAEQKRPVRAATSVYLRIFRENIGLMRVMLRGLDEFPEAQKAFQALNRAWLGRVATARARQLGDTDRQIDHDELMRRVYALGGMTDQYLAGLWLDKDPNMLPFSTNEEAVIDTLNLLWERGLEP